MKGNRTTLLLCCLAQLMVTLDSSILAVALPELKTGLGFSAETLPWVVNAFAIPIAGLLLFSGRLSDRFGSRRILAVGVGGLHFDQPGSRARSHSRRTYRRSGWAGGRCGVDDDGMPRTPFADLSSGPSSRASVRLMGRGIRQRWRSRSTWRWSHRRNPRVAVDSAGERPDRARTSVVAHLR
jgi:hypothetical protein